MSTLKPTRARIHALSLTAFTVLLTSLVVAGAASAQSAAASGAASASEARKNETTRREPTAYESVSPFVYDALGATPSIRLPALSGARAQGRAPESKKVASGDRVANEAASTQSSLESPHRTDTAAR
jgi:hypothetical protein